MLDLHGLPRVDVYLRILQELRKKMIERVEQLPAKAYAQLFTKLIVIHKYYCTFSSQN